MAEPGITVQAYHTSSGANEPIQRVVIHATAPGIGYPQASATGQAHSTALYFTSPNSGGSAHYIEDGSHEEHCVHDNTIAWHAPPNQHSIGIELCAESTYTRDQWLSPQVKPVLEMGARRCAELCHRFGVPIRKIGPNDLLMGSSGICGHVDVTNAWHQSDHTDPGPGFPWDIFISLVEGNNPEADMPLNDADKAWITAAIKNELGYALGFVEGQENSQFNQPGQPANLPQMQADIEAIKRKLGA